MRQRTSVLLLSGTLATLLFGGIVAALVVDSGGDPVAASTPTTSVTTPASELPFVEAPADTPAPTPSAVGTPAPAAVPTLTPTQAAPAPAPEVVSYTVQPGDNLSVIAAWFKLNGYSGLYEANKAIIGANPDLIRPGQVFRIVDGVISVS